MLAEIEKTIDKSDIKSIQLTEKECVISVSSNDAKNKLILNPTCFQNRQVTFYDVDSLITSVTIKDAPYEMSDSTLLSHLSQYGEIISGSMTRGKIRGSDIENGSRYVKILDCVKILPLKTEIGRFTLRLFADNNRTKCKYCDETAHPYYKCPQKGLRGENPRHLKCWNCKGPHARRDCGRDIICRFCEEEGHIAAECPKQLYGEYADEIIQGQLTEDVRNSTLNTSSTTSNVDSSSRLASTGDKDQRDTEIPGTVPDEIPNGQRVTSGTDVDQDGHTSPDNNVDGLGDIAPHTGGQHKQWRLLQETRVLIGDSNACRFKGTDSDIHDFSKSGATFREVEKVLKDKETPTSADYVTLHLGTNDIKHETKQCVVQNALTAIELVQKKWPSAEVAFSSIIPRLEKSKVIQKFNADAKWVNEEILRCCLQDGFHYIDNDEIFKENGAISKSVYDDRDPSGIHVNALGAKKLYQNLLAFLDGGISDEADMPPPRNKRVRSSGSQPSPSAGINSKQAKTN